MCFINKTHTFPNKVSRPRPRICFVMPLTVNVESLRLALSKLGVEDFEGFVKEVQEPIDVVKTIKIKAKEVFIAELKANKEYREEDKMLNSAAKSLKYSKLWHKKSAEEREPYYDIVRARLAEEKEKEEETVVKEEETVAKEEETVAKTGAKTGAKKK